MTEEEYKKLDSLVKNLNTRFNENKTLEGFIRITKKMKLNKDITYKDIKEEINIMYDRLQEIEEDNTW